MERTLIGGRKNENEFDDFIDYEYSLVLGKKCYPVCHNSSLLRTLNEYNNSTQKNFIGRLCFNRSISLRGRFTNGFFYGYVKNSNDIEFYLSRVRTSGSKIERRYKYYTVVLIENSLSFIVRDMVSLTNIPKWLDRPIRRGEPKNELFQLRNTAKKKKLYCDLTVWLHDKYIKNYASFASALSIVENHIFALNKLIAEQITTEKGEHALIYYIKQANRFGGDQFFGKFTHDPILLLDSSNMYTKVTNTCATGIYVNEHWKGVLGYAYIGTKDDGICTRRSSYVVTLNAHGSSVMHHFHRLTTLHEMGHLLGCTHDPVNDTFDSNGHRLNPCSSSDGFIMAYRSGSQQKHRQEKFSSCSSQQIKTFLYLLTKRGCLKEKASGLCGNGIIEVQEECDSGLSHEKCCGKPNGKRACKLLGHCSPSQGSCCDSKTCFYKSSRIRCFEETDCAFSSFCTGRLPHCPTPRYKPDGIFCSRQRALCASGKCCLSPCRKFNKTECICQHPYSCKVSCLESVNESVQLCLPFSYMEGNKVKTKNLIKGSPCYLRKVPGSCDEFGACKGNIPILILYKLIREILIGEFIHILAEDFDEVFDFALVFSFIVTSIAIGIWKVFNEDSESLIRQILQRNKQNVT